ncbi:MAG TPA: CHAT domain-containing protein [Actinomycetaceae bacterium]|nr:CHAT domain-containing protein [Actinomycetaceae bacterium]
MKRDIEALKPTRLTAVVGEEQLVESARQLLGEADRQVSALISPDPALAESHLERLETAVNGPMWDLVRSTAQELAERRIQIEELAQLITEEFSSLRLNFDRLANAVRRADALRLDGAEEPRKLATDVEGKFRASEPELRIGHYDKAAVAVRHAKALLLEAGLATQTESGAIVVDAEKLDEYTKTFEEQVREAGIRDDKMTRRAELFVISGGVTGLSVPYKVLLRRPGYGTIQETNLYDDVEALVMDQQLFRDTIDHISERALVGIRSSSPVVGERADTGTGDGIVRRAVPVRATSRSELLDQLDPRSRLERIGRRMYSLLIPDAMQRLIDETDEFPLTITSNNPELPWELLHDGKDFLCLKRMFARMPAGQTFPRRTRETESLTESRNPKVLLIHSEAGEPLPKAWAEIEAIRERLSSMEPKPLVTLLTGSDVTSSRLTDELSLGNYDVIHYVGHAGFDADRPHRSYLALASGEQFRAQRVQRLLEGHPVVFLNACESTRASPQSTGLPTGSTVAQAEGLGSAFVYGGAQACVGSLWPVFDDTAAQFAITFYEQLIAKRERVGEALREARQRSYYDGADAITWAAYALYGDPAYRLGSSVVTSWSATT